MPGSGSRVLLHDSLAYGYTNPCGHDYTGHQPRRFWRQKADLHPPDHAPYRPLTDLRAKGEQDNDPRYTALADIVDAHNGLWCPEAEEYLLANFNPED